MIAFPKKKVQTLAAYRSLTPLVMHFPWLWVKVMTSLLVVYNGDAFHSLSLSPGAVGKRKKGLLFP